MNKKLLLGLLALAAAHSSAEAQSLRSHVNRNLLRNAKKVSRAEIVDARRQAAAAPAPASRNVTVTPASWGTLIGSTAYDLQTNRATANRMAMSGNQLSAVWTQTCNPNTTDAFPNRGVGYNFTTDANAATAAPFVNGTVGNCPSNFGIASVRTGWPEVVHTNGNEMVIAHTAAGLTQMSRPINSGTWTPSTILPFSVDVDGPGSGTNGFWPRMVANGNTVHLIYCDNLTGNTDPQSPIAQPGNVVQNSGVIAPLLYARSLDGGATWEKSNIVLAGFDNNGLGSGLVSPAGIYEDTANVGGDSYAIAVNGNYVAICASNLGTMTMLSKSTDGGNTWSSKRIMGAFTDADVDTVNAATDPSSIVLDTDGSMSMVIDNNGTVHWFSGTTLPQVRKVSNGTWVGTGTAFVDATDAFLYWNDRDLATSNPIVIDSLDQSCPATLGFPGPCALASTAAANGGTPYSLTGIVSMPTAIMDNATGDAYVIYAGGRVGTSDDASAEGQFLRDLYLKRLSFAGNNQISVYPAKNISRDIYTGITDGAAAFSGEESVFPSALHTVESNFIHYQWMSDFFPGTSLQGTPVDAIGENAIMYDRINISTLTWAAPQVVTGIRQDAAANVFNASVAPNPTTGKTTLNLNLKQAAQATIVVRNVLGQEVLRLPATALAAGANSVSLDLSNQGAGVYFYTVAADKFTFTQRVVKQ